MNTFSMADLVVDKSDSTDELQSLVPDDEGKEKFKRAEHTMFYKRQKDKAGFQYRALLDTLILLERGAAVELCHYNSQEHLLLLIHEIPNGILRFTIDELQPVRARYKAKDVLMGEPKYEQLRIEWRKADCVSLTWGSGQYHVQVFAFPFKLEILYGDEALLTFNPEGRFCFETQSNSARPSTSSHQGKENTSGMWKKTFNQFQDVKGNGPRSVGIDLKLHGFCHAFGIPEHADSLQLKDTSGSKPYRLYNLDVFGYKINSRLGLYGSVPLLLAHKLDRTLGVFWLNTSETLVDLQYGSNYKKQEEDDPPANKSRGNPQIDVSWVSESGIIDCFILLGPSPSQVFFQYAQLTGYQALPPLFSLGYHQCRWSYKDEEDVKAVDAGFDLHTIPYDVIWLDIDHTEGKRYFTWDSKLFPNPVDMQLHLQRKNRKLVVINDPHIKVDPDWPFFCASRDGGHFVKDRGGGLYHGSCWPGDSCYLDFSSSRTRSWYARQFSLDNYKGSTDSLFVWNDMNEPSVFYGPEQTMPKDVLHCSGWEHRELHNLYGFYQHMATFEGLITRSCGLERPFVLSRSFFAGSQRMGAVWTGDNVATWEYLKISIPMLLSLSLTGMHFCGADVGGFAQDPDAELLLRWYQAGALQPFYRGHSAKQTKRREPWLFGDTVTSAVRAAIQQRYCLLPYWYTLFHLAHTSALPPMRPLWVEFPKETETFTVENQYMIGNALLACPVTDPGVTKVKILLPGSDELWYDVSNGDVHRGGKILSLPVTLETVPVFQRGGTVVTRRTGCGSCTADLLQHPFTLTVALDLEGNAEGLLYEDDGHSFNYRDKKQFCLRKFSMHSGRLHSSCADEEGFFITGGKLESVVILGQKNVKRKPTLQSIAGNTTVTFQFQPKQALLTLTGLDLDIHTDWEISI
ncbi:neutral alpha-glucosidase C isoform X1 [Tachysurus fulvidraco]|uniref:neutral alpha-glucosidase C isoform X1 n=1 Tax=Tachysurus fulvidraco TaxID=1234273 RepID=UPI000F4DD298|nr:neutral alpha-glucosidase C isoform X1 [Tachysurus fulvidraco]